MAKDKYLNLNFSEHFIGRLRLYAQKHDMKLNAVVKKAFELLEDQEGKAQPKDFDY